MTDSEIHYKSHFDSHSLKFTIKNIDNSLANGIRRTMLTDIPIVGFDTKNIDIQENTSALHNQFISHRLSLVPICLKNMSTLNIGSRWDISSGLRVYEFIRPGSIPTFQISCENNKQTRGKYINDRPKDIENNSIILVTSEDITFKTDSSEYHNDSSGDQIRKYFSQDIISKFNNHKLGLSGNDFILLDKLKLDSEGIGEKLKVYLTPNIDTAKTNASFSPVGTISYSFVEEDESIIDEVFEYKINDINKERENKSLAPLTKEETDSIRNEFYSLDSQRVVKVDEHGVPNEFEMEIESTGAIAPSYLLKYTLEILYHKLSDIYKSIDFSEYNELNINYKKVEVKKSDTMMEAFDIIIHHEEHTIGNILATYIQRHYCGEGAKVSNIFSFASYIQKHPLDKYISLRLKLKDDTDLSKIASILKNNAHGENNYSRFLEDKNIEDINFDDDRDLYTIIFTLIFTKFTIINILKTIKTLSIHWDKLCSDKNLYNMENKNYITFDDSDNKEIDDIISNNYDKNTINNILRKI